MSLKSSFLVLGFAAAIFFTLLTLSCAESSVNGIETIWKKKTVTLQNDIDPNVALKIHCWSSDDDLGEHTLYHGQNFYWRFRVNWRQTTKFRCDSNWFDPNAKKDRIMLFTAYKARRDWMVNCEHDCRWSIRGDGGYYGDGYLTTKFPLKKIFSYDG
ncbi:hypothetical protein MKX01_015082 [Papaver californicum]|nr:hypothetical protein MKX01_015082 [Papaver californicum]